MTAIIWLIIMAVLIVIELATLGLTTIWFAAGALAARIPLVFLTAPDTYFMYYLTPYIAGYAITAAGVLYGVLLYKKKKQERGIAQ